jgi:hypothetical protein
VAMLHVPVVASQVACVVSIPRHMGP